MQIVDTNIILRYILEDHSTLSPQAKKVIDENVVKVPIEVLCEVVYVLSSVYKVNRQEICDRIKFFFTETQSELPHTSAVFRGLNIFAEQKLDIVDCILIGYREYENAEIHTFDNEMQKILDKLT